MLIGMTLILNSLKWQTLLILFLAHWVGDFVFQTSAMATMKSSSVKWLTLHVLVYSLTLFVFSFFLFDIHTVLLFVVINAIAHWITDFCTSKLSEKYQDNLRLFYPIIGFDQMVHYATLVYTSSLDYSQLF